MESSIKLLSLSIVGAFGLLGVARSVDANQPERPETAIAQNPRPPQSSDDVNTQNEENEQVEEQQEDAQLRSLARITPEQAEQAARTVASGEMSHLALENEDGSVVYKVVIGQQEVLIDAGNGQVLEMETASTESAQDPPLRSSIQAPADQEPDHEIE